MGLLVVVPHAFVSVHVRVATSPLPPESQDVHTHASMQEPDPVELDVVPPVPLPLLDPLPPDPHKSLVHAPEEAVFPPSELQLDNPNAQPSAPIQNIASHLL